MIELMHTVGPSKRAACCELTDEVVVLDLASGMYYGLEGVGSSIWQYIQEPRTVQQVVDHLLSEYEISREECEAKAMAFLDDLDGHGLIAVDKYAAA